MTSDFIHNVKVRFSLTSTILHNCQSTYAKQLNVLSNFVTAEYKRHFVGQHKHTCMHTHIHMYVCIYTCWHAHTHTCTLNHRCWGLAGCRLHLYRADAAHILPKPPFFLLIKKIGERFCTETNQPKFFLHHSQLNTKLVNKKNETPAPCKTDIIVCLSNNEHNQVLSGLAFCSLKIRNTTKAIHTQVTYPDNASHYVNSFLSVVISRESHKLTR